MLKEDTPVDVAVAYVDTNDEDRTSAGIVDISMNELFDQVYYRPSIKIVNCGTNGPIWTT